VTDDDKAYAYPPIVKHHIERDVASSYDDAAAYVSASQCRVVNIQHEYGLFGGLWGSYLLRFMDRVRQPIALTMHTVLPHPDSALLSVTQGLIARSAPTDVLYLVVGGTHPGVLAVSGEAYRRELQAQVKRLGLDKHVRFENRYLTYRELVLHLLATDVYVVPYLNLKQVVSGTVAYAMGCGRAIVSTPSIYAKEVL